MEGRNGAVEPPDGPIKGGGGGRCAIGCACRGAGAYCSDEAGGLRCGILGGGPRKLAGGDGLECVGDGGGGGAANLA